MMGRLAGNCKAAHQGRPWRTTCGSRPGLGPGRVVAWVGPPHPGEEVPIALEVLPVQDPSTLIVVPHGASPLRRAVARFFRRTAAGGRSRAPPHRGGAVQVPTAAGMGGVIDEEQVGVVVLV